ncbi:hypothetical protein F8G81_00670 [Arthrobacter sp. CDRTa11]|uniref:hypothetical protein n=1 Tax=Arthrobacter sp. CDRTa11 TaxID=2651199 RepID=UPI002265DE4A|nr:hypothetical protein [Arthrobacter sp. CDRTa11]UZX01297.1 hypothetical protein F8G81_00670 [Arthrobacter sp. CDRTa11]
MINGNSQFTEKGVEEIKRSLKAEFDFTTVPLPMSALGFPDKSDGILIGVDRGKLITVSITTPRGLVEMKTDKIRIRPDIDGTVSHLDFFINYPDAQDANPEIRRAANELGFVMMEGWPAVGPEFKDGSGKEVINPGYGNKTGTVFSVEVYSNRTTGSRTFIYSALLRKEFYTPEATESIAAMGKRPGR